MTRRGVKIRKARRDGDVCPICHTEILIGQQVAAASWSKWAHSDCLVQRIKEHTP
jgi:hypothetical protein